jgi:hypothetical protein
MRVGLYSVATGTQFARSFIIYTCCGTIKIFEINSRRLTYGKAGDICIKKQMEYNINVSMQQSGFIRRS